MYVANMAPAKSSRGKIGSRCATATLAATRLIDTGYFTDPDVTTTLRY